MSILINQSEVSKSILSVFTDKNMLVVNPPKIICCDELFNTWRRDGIWHCNGIHDIKCTRIEFNHQFQVDINELNSGIGRYEFELAQMVEEFKRFFNNILLTGEYKGRHQLHDSIDNYCYIKEVKNEKEFDKLLKTYYDANVYPDNIPLYQGPLYPVLDFDRLQDGLMVYYPDDFDLYVYDNISIKFKEIPSWDEYYRTFRLELGFYIIFVNSGEKPFKIRKECDLKILNKKVIS